MLIIRPEEKKDISKIHALNEKAFGQPIEANLVDALRNAGALTYSLVAVLNGRIVGHIAFSPVSIDNGHTKFHALGLAPMAVHPDYQRTGIGKAMFQYWLDHCATGNDNLVVVLGHPGYYPKFGFVPAGPRGIVWEQDAPKEAFMVLELKDGALEKISGTVRFHSAFNTV